MFSKHPPLTLFIMLHSVTVSVWVASSAAPRRAQRAAGRMARIQADDPAYPAYLEVGTEVSAKYRGAFCEAKVRKVVKQVKAKVNLKFNMGTVVVSDEHIKGRLHVGSSVEVKTS
ncbi:AT-rich interactive domain-containing protein 4A [Amphibalanus amphitrite]|uniref:AT-rich interactive domain-containing protein 4A n=1 Tax=Amphibalanus amphitrite TaxID=1232801 RepID=A0A6A4UYG7_AMPAM|nr:AT-rich interactive domain-containing protein 4A [Amphibalanus amphitrite]